MWPSLWASSYFAVVSGKAAWIYKHQAFLIRVCCFFWGGEVIPRLHFSHNCYSWWQMSSGKRLWRGNLLTAFVSRVWQNEFSVCLFFYVSRAAEVRCGPVQVRGEMQFCLQPAGDWRLDRREEEDAGQTAAVWNGACQTGPCKQHHTPATGKQGPVHVPLSG